MNKFLNSNRLLTFFNYVYWFLICNALIVLLNIPIILFLNAFGFTSVLKNLPVFLLCALFFFPSFTAGLYCMGKIARHDDLFIFKDFFSSYKKNFIQSMILGLIYSILFLGFYTNYLFFSGKENLSVLTPVFFVGMFIIGLIIPHSLILLSRFEFKILNLLKTSLILLFTRPGITFANTVSILFILMLFQISPGISILFIFSLLCFLFMFVNKELLSKLEGYSNS
ncbi:Protein of unknown function, DUF624 [Clostridium cavendishii DSM 21758]|uniref:Membrane protein YesL n=1 Tax=Clostridium cavendishii DSM 21758 TaxID=1121302 RepID=A0A1M6MV59_9CLOT|nr:DUF624 domain-containing protein [Clostridium cavendishii]SHJ87385.1 Protein of unknown function, DUF624 [Clostridium cavendishii DSM 21758]